MTCEVYLSTEDTWCPDRVASRESRLASLCICTRNEGISDRTAVARFWPLPLSEHGRDLPHKSIQDERVTNKDQDVCYATMCDAQVCSCTSSAQGAVQVITMHRHKLHRHLHKTFPSMSRKHEDIECCHWSKWRPTLMNRLYDRFKSRLECQSTRASHKRYFLA